MHVETLVALLSGSIEYLNGMQSSRSSVFECEKEVNMGISEYLIDRDTCNVGSRKAISEDAGGHLKKFTELLKVLRFCPILSDKH